MRRLPKRVKPIENQKQKTDSKRGLAERSPHIGGWGGTEGERKLDLKTGHRIGITTSFLGI